MLQRLFSYRTAANVPGKLGCVLFTLQSQVARGIGLSCQSCIRPLAGDFARICQHKQRMNLHLQSRMSKRRTSFQILVDIKLRLGSKLYTSSEFLAVMPTKRGRKNVRNAIPQLNASTVRGAFNTCRARGIISKITVFCIMATAISALCDGLVFVHAIEMG